MSSYHPDEVNLLDIAESLFRGEPADKAFIYGGTLFFSFLHGLVSIAWLLLPWFSDHTLLQITLLLGRLVMVLASLGAVGVLYLIGKRLMGVNGGLLCGLCAAIMPGMIIWSQRLRPDELTALLVTLMIWVAMQVFHHEGRRQNNYMILAALFSGVLLSFRFPLLVFGLMPIMAQLMQRGYHLTLKTCANVIFPRTFLVYLIGVPVGYLASSPHSLLFPDVLLKGMDVMLGYQVDVSADTIGKGPKVLQVWWSLLHQGLGYPLYFSSVAGLVLAIRDRQKWAMILLVATIPYLVFMVISAMVVVRFTLPVLPVMAVFSTYSILLLYRKVGALFTLSALGLLSAITLMANLAFLKLEAGKNVRQDVSQWLESSIAPSECIALFIAYLDETAYLPSLQEGQCHSLLPLTGNAGTAQFTVAQITDYYVNTLGNGQFRYIVLHEYQYGDMERLQTEHPVNTVVALYQALQVLPVELVFFRKLRPVLAGIDFSSWFSGHEMGFVNPGYKIYRVAARADQ